MTGDTMVNRAYSPPSRPNLLLNRTAALCLALAVIPACASLTGQKSGEAGSGNTYVPVTLEGVPDSLQEGAESAVEVRTGEPPASLLEARRRASRAAGAVEEYLASEGYFLATAQPALVDTLTTRPQIDVDAGTRFRIASVKVQGLDTLTSRALAEVDTALQTLKPGAWAITRNIESVETELLKGLRASGYAFADSDGIDAVASRADHTLEVTYRLKPGPYVRLGDLSLPENLKTKDSAIRVLQNWKPGEPYAPQKIETLRTRLRSTGLYDGIGVKVRETAEADGLHTVDLQLTEAKRRSVGAGISVSTADGSGATAFWERRNLTRIGDTLRVEAQIAERESGLATHYERPNIGRYGRNFHAEAGVRSEETDAYDLQGVKVAADLSQPFNTNFTLSGGVALDATRSIDYRLRSLGVNDYRELVTLSFPLGATYDTVKDPLDPQDGNRIFLGVEPGVSFGAGEASYTRLQSSASTYLKIADELVAAFRAEAGTFLGDDDVPVDRKFFAGGGGSVRGFEYQSLSPKDVFGNPIGGDALFNASAELRWRKSERWGYVAFLDAGSASTSFDEAVNDMRASFGVGVRFYPGFGPVRFDIATPVDRREGDDPVQIYVSIGQAF